MNKLFFVVQPVFETSKSHVSAEKAFLVHVDIINQSADGQLLAFFLCAACPSQGAARPFPPPLLPRVGTVWPNSCLVGTDCCSLTVPRHGHWNPPFITRAQPSTPCQCPQHLAPQNLPCPRSIFTHHSCKNAPVSTILSPLSAISQKKYQPSISCQTLLD